MFASYRPYLAFIILFLLIAGLLLGSSATLKQYHIDGSVLTWANYIFFFLSVISVFIHRLGIANKNPHVFVRSVMSSMLVKMFACIIFVVIYVTRSGEHFNKRSVIIALFIYLLYLAAEVFVLMRMHKNSKENA